ncbi:MAG TPA: redoxin domain-containing protein [Pirellulales bacterium]|nr:redoxin domain-containing protein [Pirellulales bacterium]
MARLNAWIAALVSSNMFSRTISTWLALVAISTARAEPSERRIGDFLLNDTNGQTCRLSDWRQRKLVVVVFLGVECPLARLYTSRLNELTQRFGPCGVQFVGVDSNEHDALDEIARFATEYHLAFPLFIDAAGLAARSLGAERTPEVFVLDHDRVVRYRGRIDDQYGVGVRRSEPRRCDLAVAIDELLAGKPVSVDRTDATGCFIGRAPPATPRMDVTYCRDIAPIVQRRCQTCHRPGQAAPFVLSTYQDAVDWAETIAEVVEQGRMPPWHADPRYGRFANDPRLTGAEKRLVATWVHAGAAEGDRAELPRPATWSDEWKIGRPDQVVSIPMALRVPALGVVEYQIVDVNPGFTEDRWIRAAEIRPGNRAVVHHASVYLKPPGAKDPAEQGALGSFCLAAMAPGTPPLELSEGFAKRVPAGWCFVFVIHYVAIGTEQLDQTSIGLVFADSATVRKEVATKVLLDADLRIPPHAADYRVERTWTATDDLLLLALFPHMHLRGKSFRYEASYPDGAREVLLDVPKYDFNWENRYVLAEPKRLPAGTVLHCIAHYDNSFGNPANPDPSVTVRAGPLSTDEMFNGYFEVALANQDRLSFGARMRDLWPSIARAVVLTAVVVVGWTRLRRRKR